MGTEKTETPVDSLINEMNEPIPVDPGDSEASNLRTDTITEEVLTEDVTTETSEEEIPAEEVPGEESSEDDELEMSDEEISGDEASEALEAETSEEEISGDEASEAFEAETSEEEIPGDEVSEAFEAETSEEEISGDENTEIIKDSLSAEEVAVDEISEIIEAETAKEVIDTTAELEEKTEDAKQAPAKKFGKTETENKAEDAKQATVKKAGQADTVKKESKSKSDETAVQKLENPVPSVEDAKKKADKKLRAINSRNTLLGVLIALVIIILGIYGYGAYYFSSHFFLNAYVNGQKVGNLTVSEAEKIFTQDFDSHVLTLTEKERTETINPKDVGLVISVGSQVSDFFKSQNKWTWFMNLKGKKQKTVSLDVSYDEKQLKQTVNNLECFKKENVVAPKSAYLKKGEDGIELVPEVVGNTVKKKSLIKEIETAFSTCSNSINLEESNLYKKPTVYRTNKKLKAAYKKAVKYASSVITYDFKYTTVVVNYKKFKDWLVIKSNLKVYFDEEKVAKYVTKLCNDFNTMGIARKFKTSSGKTITITEGDYGWKIYYDKELAKLKKELKSGKEITREPIYSYKAQCRDGAEEDIGDSYVEVSVSAQTLWLYVNGKCILTSPVVTGDVTKSGRATDKGIYALTYKQRNATLSGQGYASPVSYWMPFNGNEGLHDASWRSSFGGSIYKGNGSHGCVNCPVKTAKKLYKYVDTGFPVIIY